MADGTVPLRLSVVNTLFPVESRGTRLRKFLLAQTGGAHGWVNSLAAESGVKRQSLSAWMGDRAEPDLASIREVARVLRVRPFQIVAAMDGDPAVNIGDPAVRAAIREEIEQALDERLGRRPEDHGQAGAA